MKPVVSSIAALAIAIAPLGAFAAKGPHPHKTTHAAHASKPGKGGKPVAAAAKAANAEKSDKHGKGLVVVAAKTKPGKKDGAIEPVVHHAHDVDLGGLGHKEPRVGEKSGLVAASMVTRSEQPKPIAHGKLGKPIAAKAERGELPKLPSVAAGKPSKGGAEKGARKPAASKGDAANDDGGEPSRDEDTAELVARIRGLEPSGKTTKNVAHEAAAKAAPPPCVKDPVEIVRGPELERFPLTRCDGAIASLAVERLSILVRPGGAARPTAPVAELAKKPGSELAPGIRRVDPRLIGRIQALAEHFGKPGAPAKLSVISGYRPASVGSMHSTGRAIDFRVEGVKNEEVVAFCKTLEDTGCGYYPNSSFVHVDVRDAGAGHVTWIDASGPGETPRYVQSWPPPAAPPPPERSGLHRTSLLARDEVDAETKKTLEQLAAEGESLLRARRPIERDGDDDHADESR